jgi:two-component system C4-dicarboxylate transport sensor histidine kinase DctB
MKVRRLKSTAATLLVLALLVVVSAAYVVAERVGVSTLSVANAHRIELYASSLQNELRRNEYLPPVVALSHDVQALLNHPNDATLQATVNNYVQVVSQQAGVSAIYVMDKDGLTLASSNWDQPSSFVRMNFAYRPYFQDALQGRPGRFYGIGTVSRQAGYYFAHGVKSNGRVVGVVAVKVSLDKLDLAWQQPGERILVADGNGVIFLSSQSAWKFKTLATLSDATVDRLKATRQYADANPLDPVGFEEQRALSDGTSIVAVAEKTPSPGNAQRVVSYLVRRSPIPGTDWQISVLSDISAQRTFARIIATVAALAVVLSYVLLLYFLQRRKLVRDTLETKAALLRANEDLEQKVGLRTQALSDSNRQLHTEINDRKRAEETLKETLNELVHAAKMAALGKIVAGITHELNQPLAALQTLSANTIVFFERGQREVVESNLEMIGHLAKHMGKITSQLKRFARKSIAERRPVNVANAIGNASLLLAQVVRERRATVTVSSPPSTLYALCDGSRLEQVLVNLLGNALDAVAQSEAGAIEVHFFEEGDALVIEVHDNGDGISEEVQQHLFEPFFSTKEQGVGLGLGLAISADIVREFGGTLKAGASPLGGAVFTVRLPLAHVPREAALHV